MKRFGVLGLLAILLGAGIWALADGVLVRPVDADSPAPVRTAPVVRTAIGSTVLATGVVRPQVGAEVAVGSRVSGVLRRLHVTVGDRVRQGELLAELDSTEFEARRMQAAASLESARIEREFARRQYERAVDLLEARVIAQAELDDTERSFRAWEARVREAEATLRSAEIQLEYTRIRAPIGGVVASVTTQVGETVAASFAAPTFVTIMDLDRLEVWAYVDETDIGRIQVGQKATFTVDTYMGVDFEGAVTAIQPQAEIQNNVVNYVTVLEIGDTAGYTLRPEMTTTVNILLDGRSEVVAVPNAAVRTGPDGTYVLLPGSPDPVGREVRTGVRGRTHTEITEGLTEGETVIVDTEND